MLNFSTAASRRTEAQTIDNPGLNRRSNTHLGDRIKITDIQEGYQRQDFAMDKIRACIFDLDGLLINSEDLYTVCTNEILSEYGKPNLPWHIKAQLQGRPGPEAGKIFQEWAQLPVSHDVFMAKIQACQKRLFPTTKPLPGVEKLLQHLSAQRQGNVQIALATSSHRGNFHLKTDHMKDMFQVFPEENRVMGDDPRIPAGKGKPAPDIYLLALKTINESRRQDGETEDIMPKECLVFEDSVPGVESGRRAGMQVVWVPHPELLLLYKGKEKEVLAGQMGEYKEEIQPESSLKVVGAAGKPGKIDDGYAILLESLEDFSYERYGLLNS